MIRRDFMMLIGGAAAAWPVVARGQQTAMPVVGFLMGIANDAFGQARAKVFQKQLETLGWTDGRNVTIEFRWGEGRNEQFAEIAAEFVRLKVDVIVTVGTPTTAAAKRATSTIPIVFVGAGDPVGTDLVASLARLGGSVTGLSNQTRDLAGKRVEFLHEMVPGFSRLAILANAGNVSAVLEMREVQEAARTLGLETVTLQIRRTEEIAADFEPLKGPTQALYVVIDNLTNTNARRINELAFDARLPTMYGTRQQLEAGGLMSYGPDSLDLFRHAAGYVDKILRGMKPGDIPVEQPTKFELIINAKTAKALGLTVPQSLLAIADEVIE